MKPLVLALGCLFLPLQTVYYMDCCCGDFCTHKNACSGCEEDQKKPCDVHPDHQPNGNCCLDHAKPSFPKKEEHHKKACSHLSPSSEVTAHSALTIPQAPPSLELARDFSVTVPGTLEAGVQAFLCEAVPRPRTDVPRHLLLSVLQV